MAAFTGLLGVVVGVLLASLFTTRRERWNRKCDLYLQLLEHIGVTHMILFSWIRTPSRDRGVEFLAEGEQISRALARGRLILDRDTALAIDELETKWRIAGGLGDAPAVVQERVRALESAYERVRGTARRDLRL